MRTMLRVVAVLALLAILAAGLYMGRDALAEVRPNFVVIVVDDLDRASVEYMDAVNRRIVNSGVSFTRFFATTPLCCPSRASLLRGQYAHNHGVLRNTGANAGFSAFHESGHESETMATLFDAAGYETALIGKYLNGYSLPGNRRGYVPPGWDYWVAGTDHTAYASFDYELNVNGELVQHGNQDSDYLTDVLGQHAVEFLDRSASSSEPFLLYLAPYAPHAPATPAPRHIGLFAGATAPRSPAFNERKIRDKPSWVKASNRFTEPKLERIDGGFAQRLESLQAVDEMVDAVVTRLEDLGEADSTYVFLLSDNGYFLGEHRQPHGKDAPYDAASRVPLFVLGPDVAAGSTSGKIALNIDLLPTLLDLSGLAIPAFVDGRSLRPLLLADDRKWRRAALLEGFGKETEFNERGESPTPAFRALRTERILYVEYETGERELYDLRKDSHQLSNIARDASKELRRTLARRVDALATCEGSGCRTLEEEPLTNRRARRDNAS